MTGRKAERKAGGFTYWVTQTARLMGNGEWEYATLAGLAHRDGGSASGSYGTTRDRSEADAVWATARREYGIDAA